MRAAWAAAALVALGGTAAAKDKLCVVEGKATDPFIVAAAAKGGPTILVQVHQIPVTVHPPGSSDEPAHVEVRGALAFEGTAAANKIPYKTKAFVDATNGMVRLAPATEGFLVRTHNKWAEADLLLGEVRLRGLFLPCESLTLDAVAHPEPSQQRDPDEDVWVAAQKTLHLRTAPGSGPTLEVELLGDLQALDLHPTEHRGPWLRVRSRWPDGTTLTGWVNVKEVARPKARSQELGDVFVPAAACQRAPLKPEPDVHVVEAKVAPGTAVSADRLFQWATVRGGDTLTLRWRGNESWAEIVGAPGLVGGSECPEHSTVLDEAWIPRSSIQLPAP
jgi:hypothetical protein